MAERWVVNASPIIVLAKIRQEGLLQQLPDEAIVPESVVDEIRRGPADDPARHFLDRQVLRVVSVPLQAAVAAWDLGSGETDVLSYAYSTIGWRVVVDDKMARRCAKSFSIPVIGTLGIIIRARRAGLVEAVVPILRDLIDAGFRIDDELLRSSLPNSVGERWD